MRARRVVHLASGLVGVLLFAGALVVLRRELAETSWAELAAAARAVPLAGLGWALALTGASYLVLTLYDLAALRHVGRALPYPRVALTSFIAFVTSHNVGMAGIGGSAVRLRIYTGLGLSAADVATVVAFCGLTYWLGFAALGGLVFAFVPLELPAELALPFASTRGLGWLLLALASGYMALALTRRRPIRVRAWSAEPPSARLVATQLALATADWVLSAAVVWVLLPPAAGGFAPFFGVYVAAALLSLLSHVPGGLGVFETVVLVLTPDSVPREDVLGALLVYRCVYYLLPLFAAVAAFGAFEAGRRREHFRLLAARLAPVVSAGLPRLMAAATFVAGVVLLLGGLLPEPSERLAWLRDPLPPLVVDAAALAAALAGVALLALSLGLSRRLAAAWWASLSVLAAGGAAALVRGADYEEAALLLLVFTALLPTRAAFHRRAVDPRTS